MFMDDAPCVAPIEHSNIAFRPTEGIWMSLCYRRVHRIGALESWAKLINPWGWWGWWGWSTGDVWSMMLMMLMMLMGMMGMGMLRCLKSWIRPMWFFCVCFTTSYEIELRDVSSCLHIPQEKETFDPCLGPNFDRTKCWISCRSGAKGSLTFRSLQLGRGVLRSASSASGELQNKGCQT